MNRLHVIGRMLKCAALAVVSAVFLAPEAGAAPIPSSDDLKLVDALGAILVNPACPLVAGARRCFGGRPESGNEFPSVLTFNVPAPAAGQVYRSSVLSLFEGGDVTDISDRVRLVPRPGRGGTINLSVSFLSGSTGASLPFGASPINIPETAAFQDLTGSLFSNSTAGIQAAPPFVVMFGSDCGGPTVCPITGPLPDDFPLLPSVPEPATLALFGAGLAGLGALRRRRSLKA